jgi:hypothetical protein
MQQNVLLSTSKNESLQSNLKSRISSFKNNFNGMAQCGCSGSQQRPSTVEKNEEFVITDMKITPYY